ncbi:hypothetical protein OIU79_007482 [Salix purpurea]|uniref:Uncharacterized protein n=1 Tax=Salix purpurea TaxID=77065 RepID=A0A9Q0TXZ6_SALPP|nr:hypothetical protein OIU79_007482 [Salix purpurea]
MAERDRLARIGLEGFAAIDEHFGRAKRRPPVPKVMDSNEAAPALQREGFHRLWQRGGSALQREGLHR